MSRSASAITFDFHDTIAHCDEWFEIEVHRLPSAFFTWREREVGAAADPEFITEVDAAYRRFRKAIHRHGHELPAERSLVAVAESMGMQLDPDEVDRGVKEIMRSAFESVAPVEGAIDTIHRLTAAGIPLGIVSSAVYHPFLIWTLDRFGLARSFHSVTTSASAGFYKSRPEIFWQTLLRIGAEPHRSAHIGDSLRFDVAGARRAGMLTAWYNKDQSAGDAASPELTVTSMRDAAPRLLTLLNGQWR
ncbi:MAG: HAD family hydrolase [Thermomicrobiales bacterium]